MAPELKKFLVAVDGSRHSLEAVRYVSKCFPPKHMEIVLFNVFSKVPEFFYDLRKEPRFQKHIVEQRGWKKTLKDSIESFMREACEILINAEVPNEAIVVNIHERKEGIARDIIRESKKGYNAVVVGRSGLSKFKDFFIIGSVANKLLASITDVPIFVVGGKPESGKILLALDKSEGTMHAVDYVLTMLSEMISHVTLFHVVRGFNIFERKHEYLFDQGYDEQKWTKTVKSEMESVFTETTNRLIKAGLNAKRITIKIVTGVPSRSGAIVQEASEGEYGTIVVGRRGLSNVKEFFMGRVSNNVVEFAKEHTVLVVS